MSPIENMDLNGDRLLISNGDFDDDAFEIFFRIHFTPLCAYCQYKFGFDLEMAKDAVHNGFMKLWETRSQLANGLSLKAYLYKIVTNICLDALKHQKVKSRSEKFLLEQQTKIELNNGFDQADYKQLTTDIDNAIAELPEQMRKVFMLCRYDGLKYSEVADHLSISVKTVETQMSRALAKLRQKLAGYLGISLVLMMVTLELTK